MSPFPETGNTVHTGNKVLLIMFHGARLFPEHGNALLSENNIIERAVEVLRGRLPKGWTLDVTSLLHRGPNGVIDGRLGVAAPDGRPGVMFVEVKQRLDPRRAFEVVAQGGEAAAKRRPLLVVAPWMSHSTREILAGAGINVLDLTGSVRIELSEPGLFIEAHGAVRDPSPATSQVTLRGSKAARIVRTLCVGQTPFGVRQLAAEAGTTPGYVSKLLVMLGDQAAVRRSTSGKVVGVDVRRLLEQWADHAPLEARASVSSWIAPRGPTALRAELGKTHLRYAVTGSLAASRRAPIAPPRLVSIYVDDPDSFAAEVGLRPADAGANVLLLVPDDGYVFQDSWTEEGVQFAALPQVVADLFSGPGRGPAEAEALLGWMSDQEVGNG